MAAAESLYLIDAYSLIFQVFHALPEMTSPSGLPTNAVFGFTKDLLYLRDERKPTYWVCVFDAEGPTFRDRMYSDYKAHRAPTPEDLKLQLPLIRQVVEGMRVPHLAVEGVEADDVIATLARAGERRGLDVYICSSDKDCRQLLSESVRIFNLRKRTEMRPAELMSDWGVQPDQVIDYQTLVGDSVDNVPGVEGIGPKTASQLLQQYGTLDNLLIHIEDLKGKRKENLLAARTTIPLSRELVRLKTDVPLAEDWDNWRVRPWDGARMLDLFTGFGFRTFTEMARQSLPRSSASLDPGVSRSNAPRGAMVQGDLFEAGEEPTPSQPEAEGSWSADYHLVNTAESFAAFVAELEKQERIALDLETTSLDPREAAIVGLAFCWKAGEAWYLALRGPDGESLLPEAETLGRLKGILENSVPAKVNQNIKYDMQVLWRHGIHLRGIVGDPMVADYLLHAGERSHNMEVLSEKHLQHRPIPITDLIGKGKQQKRMDSVPCSQVARYAGEDADIAWRLCELLEPQLQGEGFKKPAEGPATSTPSLFLYDDLEIPLIDVLARMEDVGIRLDVPFLERMGRDMASSLSELEKDIHRLAGRPFNIASVKQLREVLYLELGFRPGRKTAVTGAASTDQETLEELAKLPEGELPRRLLEHRKISKLKSTYVDALPLLADREDRVHASFNQTVAATGRLSSSDPNLQNIPIRSELGGQIRQAFLPRPGWLLIAADYSQIELRFLAHFSRDEELRRAFAEDRDIHAMVAAQVFGVTEDQVDAGQRRMAKMVNFGVIYGISAFGLAQRLGISKEEASKFIDAYFARYPKVLAYQDALLEQCRKVGYVATILGRRRRIDGLRARTTYKSRTQPEREAINMQVQGSAADLIKVAMVALDRELRGRALQTRMLLQIHDELVFEAPPEEADAALDLVRREMTGALSDRLEVPLRVDVGIGNNWLELK